eukprot:5822048-Pleurochrysis_carterae.AAC.2
MDDAARGKLHGCRVYRELIVRIRQTTDSLSSRSQSCGIVYEAIGRAWMHKHPSTLLRYPHPTIPTH